MKEFFVPKVELITFDPEVIYTSAQSEKGVELDWGDVNDNLFG